MLRTFLFLLVNCLAAGVVTGQPPEPAPMPAKKIEARGMGRLKPKQVYDYGDYRAVVGSDGKTRFFPRIGKHVDLSKTLKAAPLPDGPLNRMTEPAKKAMRLMYGNDSQGDCVIASRAHEIGLKSANDAMAAIVGTTAEALADYVSACGRGDNGCDMSAVNQYQQRTGMLLGGKRWKSDGSASVDHTNKDLVKTCIYLFGGLDVGFSLPNEWYQSPDGAVWDVTNTGIVGGHEVQVYDYDKDFVYLMTWAGTRKWTWAAFLSTRWIDECYVTLSAQWYGDDKLAPNGIDVAGLKAALDAVAGGQVPPLPTPPTPVPVPVPVPVPPVPGPTPGKPFTGTITETTTYANGVKGATVVTVQAAGEPAGDLKGQLEASGTPADLIAAILKLVDDVKKKQWGAAFGDVLLILSLINNQKADLTPAPRGLTAPEWALAG